MEETEREREGGRERKKYFVRKDRERAPRNSICVLEREKWERE
jgi:hypothetical protein